MFLSTKNIVLKTAVASMALAAATVAFSTSSKAAEEIVFGSSLPMTGVFGFAGVAINAGYTDYFHVLNENGGIDGRKVKYVAEDSAYKVDRAIASFKKITETYKPAVFFSANTGFFKAAKAEIAARTDILVTGSSFATEITNEKEYPNAYISGPSYAQMMTILLKYVAKEKPGAKVAFVHSSTGFGRDPIAAATATAKKLGLDLVETIVTKPGGVDVTSEVAKLRRARPDYILFHGYVLAPINEFMAQIKALNMGTKFMGTFWSTNELLLNKVGEVADGYLGVLQFSFYNAKNASGPLMDAVRAYTNKTQPEGKRYRTTLYMQAWHSAAIATEAVRRTLKAGKPLTGANMKASLKTIKNWNVGGLVAGGISFENNSFPYAQIFRLNAAEKRYDAVSGWIKAD